MKLLFKLSLFFFILIVGVAAIAIYHTFYNQLPDKSATIDVPGITNEVSIHWDPYGVPYIFADSEEDLFFSVGYIHAQDRLWQLTLSQLMAEGRFSEYLGSDFIELDKHQRTIGIWRTAKKIEAESPDSLLTILQHYADGINAYISDNKKRLPIELTLLGLEPPKWTPTHSIAMSRLLAWDQNMHWKNEITLALISAEIGADRLRQIYPDRETGLISEHTLNRSTIENLSENFLQKEFEVRSLLQKQGSSVGSNAWAVRGSRTASGRPILAGDPHMGLSMPGFWYELSASAPGYSISGATIPGAPFVVLGQNRDIAWSITNMMADDTDFFLVQNDPVNPVRYVADSLNGEAQFKEFEWQQEIIKVESADDYFFRIPHTEQGPVINSVHPDSSGLGIMPVAMQWAGHEVSHELWSIYKMNRAQNLEQFTNALSHFGSPAMNFVYADSDDNVALIGAGNLPIRSGSSIIFRNSWNPEHHWGDWIPFSELPREVNPDRGYVANANNRVAGTDYEHYIGRFWASPSRISRISFLLDENESATSQTMQQIQTDIYSEHAAELIEILLPLIRSSQNSNEFDDALSYLENWDYRYSTNSTAATIFDLFFMNLSERILKQEIPGHLYDGFVRLEYIPVNSVVNILSDGSSFFNIADEENVVRRNQVVRSAMTQTLDQLTEQLGPEPFEWRWESVHTLTLKPPLLGDISEHPDSPAALRLIVNNLLSKGPIAVPGHGMTINKGEYSWNNPFDVTLGPSIRRIVDFASPSRSESVLPTGQSGHPLSSNYGDQTEMWIDGRYRYIYSDSTFLNDINVQTMKLRPFNRN